MKVNKKGVGGTKGRPKSEFFSFLRSVCYSIVKLCPLPAHCYSPPPETQHSWSRPFATKEIKQLGITKGWGRSPTWRKELIFGKPPTKALRCEWLGAEDQKESDKESCKACKCSPPSAAVAETALAPQWRMPCSYVFPVDCEGTVYLCLSKHYETLFSFRSRIEQLFSLSSPLFSSCLQPTDIKESKKNIHDVAEAEKYSTK
jgi:hypothetical protein